MKKIVIYVVVLVVIIVILGIGITLWLYKEQQENIRIDAEAVSLKENRTVEFGEKVKVSDFIENLNGTLVNDYEIDTEKVGDIEVLFEYINIKNKTRVSGFMIRVIDVNAPQIFSGSSFTVNVGYDRNLTDVLLSADDVDDNPKREILGEYDFNTAGSYDLTYIVTDSSGNQVKRQFVLYVKEKTSDKTNNNEIETTSKKLYIADVLERYKTDETKIGIDVSKWQQNIDWQAVKDAGIEFVMIRMGHQTDYDGECVLDPYFISNIEGAKQAGLPVGIYFYSYARNVEQATEQAEWVKEVLKDYEIDLPVAFDWESWNSFNKTGMSLYTINKVANTFLDILENAGYKGMLYSSKNYLEKIWYPTKHETWLAQYNSVATFDGDYSIWQMSNCGRVDGINTDVDIDIMYLSKCYTNTSDDFE